MIDERRPQARSRASLPPHPALRPKSRDSASPAAACTLKPSLDRTHQLFGRFARLAAEVFHLPLAVVALVDRDHRITVSATNSGTDAVHRAGLPIAVTVSENRTLVIPDAEADPLWRSHIGTAPGMAFPFYAGAPLSWGGQAIGVLCLLGHQPHHAFDAGDRQLLESLALLVSDLLVIDQSGRGSGHTSS